MRAPRSPTASKSVRNHAVAANAELRKLEAESPAL